MENLERILAEHPFFKGLNDAQLAILAGCASNVVFKAGEFVFHTDDTADTDTGPHCMGTFASRTTHRAGNAIIMAAEEAKKTLFEIAADELEARPDDREHALCQADAREGLPGKGQER